MPPPIPVVCDRCRAGGLAGEDPFEAFGPLLDFDPVPRKTSRADGWDADVQRAFIAALSLTGSDRAACRAVGKSQFGVTQLLRHEGSGGFRAAYEQAMAMAADERGRRLREGLRAVASERSGWKPADPPWSAAETRRSPPEPARRGPGRPPAQTARPEPTQLEIVRSLVRIYVTKLAAERRCRLEGRIAEADFYLRQLTFAEVALDLATVDAVDAFEQLRRGGHDLLDVAETDWSRLLDAARRRHWEQCGEPPRPEHPPRRLLVEHDGYATEPSAMPSAGETAGEPIDWDERARLEKERNARDAEAQIAWETEARLDYERRREAEAAARQAGREAEQSENPPRDGEPDRPEPEPEAEAGGGGASPDGSPR